MAPKAWPGAGGDNARGPRWSCRHCGCKRNESYFSYCKHCKKWWNAPIDDGSAGDKARGDPAALRREAAGVAAGQATKSSVVAAPSSSASKSELEQMVQLRERVGNQVLLQQAQQELQKLHAENDALKGTVAETGERVGQTAFDIRLRQLVPDFDAVDADPNWIAWLNEVDPLLQGPRRNLVADKYNRGDADAVAKYIQLWSDTQPQPRANKQAELERQVAPSKATSNQTTSTQPRGRQYRESEIGQLFNKVRDLTIKGRADEAAQLESEITLAYAEGRVVSG